MGMKDTGSDRFYFYFNLAFPLAIVSSRLTSS